MKKETTGYPSIDKPWLQYYSDEAKKVTVPVSNAYNYIYEKNRNNLNYSAINYYGKKYNYKQMFNQIKKVTRAFINAGVRKGDCVTFCMPTFPETIFSFYSLNRIGALANFIDLRMNYEKIMQYINNTNSKIIVVYDGIMDKIEKFISSTQIEKVVVVSAADSLPIYLKVLFKLKKEAYKNFSEKIISWKDFVNLNMVTDFESDRMGRGADISAAIVYTGGTTGEAKGAVLTNMCLNASCEQYCVADIPRGMNDRFIDIMPPFIAYGLVDGIHLPLSLGMECILIPNFNPNEFYNILKRYKPNHFMGIPSHFEILMRDKRCENMDLSYLKNAGCGGDVVPPSLEKEFNDFLKAHNNQEKMRVGYGMTENAAMTIFDLNNNMTKIGSVGIPMVLTNVGIFDENGKELTYDQEGELWISSPQIIKGYYKNDSATNEVIIDKEGERWIKTGDIAKIDQDGNVFIIGRRKSMFIRPDGHNVFPNLISNILSGCPLIREVCVVGIKSKFNSYGKIPTAIVVLNDLESNLEKAKKDILEYQSHLLGERDGAIDIRFRNEIPKTPIGKVDYLQIEKEEAQSDINFDTLIFFV